MKLFVTSLAGVAVAVAVATPAAAKANNPNINLEFRPQQTVAGAVANVSGAMLDRPAALDLVDDRRYENPKTIGSRTDDDDRLYDLVATSDVLEFVRANLVESAGKWGVRLSSAESLGLHVRLLQVDIVETNQAVGATYQATVRLAYSLQQGDEEPRASNSVTGDATRYGKKFSQANCNEVLSDAMLEAFAAMFSDPALQRAWRE